MIKFALKEYRNKFDCSFAKFVNIKTEMPFLFRDNSVRFVKDLKSDFYYSIFVSTKFQRSSV